jgi:hypothetical protein
VPTTARSQRRLAGGQQALAHRLQLRHAHVDSQRLPLRRERSPIEALQRFTRVRRDEAHRLGMIAMRERYAGICGAGERCRNAWHNFIGNSICAQELHLLAAPGR